MAYSISERCASVTSWLDNDIAPAKRLGMRTVRVRQGIAPSQRPRTADETPDLIS